MSASFHTDDELLGKAYDPQLMRRLMSYVRPYIGWATVALALVLTMTALMIAGPLIVGAFVDAVLKDTPTTLTTFFAEGLGLKVLGDPSALITVFVVLFAALELAKFVIDYAQALLLQTLGQNVLFDLRMQLFAHVTRQPVAFFHQHPVGRFVTRIANDVGALTELFSSGLISVFKDIFLILGVMVAMFVLSTELALVSLALLPVMVVVTFIFQRLIRTAYRESRKLLSRINAFTAEQISGMREVQLFGREVENRRRFDEINDAHYDAQYRTVRLHGFYRPTIHVIYATSLALVVVFGAYQVVSPGLQGALEWGALATFILLVQYLFSPIRDLAEKYNILQAAMAASERIFALLDTDVRLPRPDAPRDAELTANGIRGEVRFTDVHFRYNPDVPVLRGVSWHAAPGEHVAIVGHTGAGKSTCINLLGRFYDVESGAVTLDGIDLRELTTDTIRRSVAIVHQDVFCFSGTIADNIGLGDPAISRARIEAAARAVNAHRFIERFADGYDHEVVEGGKTLSQGERQLLAFARALAHDPPILVLDEATANIDTPTELLIQEALQTLIAGRTAIIIAHRLSTIRTCDRIYVFDDGLITESGSHEALVAQGGRYAHLCRQQAIGRVAAEPSPAETTARPAR